MKFLSKLSRNNRERAIVLHYLTHYAAGLQGFAFAPQEQKFASRAVIGLDLLARELNLTEMVRPAKVRMLKRQLPWFARELSASIGR